MKVFEGIPDRFKVFLLVCCFALMQTVPSAIKGFPFIFFDSRGYHNAGKAVVQTIADKAGLSAPEAPVEAPDASASGGVDQVVDQSQSSDANRAIPMSRSPYYGVLVYVALNTQPYFLVAVQSLIVAYALWLTMLQLPVRNRERAFLVTGAVCALVTPLPFFIGYAMPDVFAALIPICVFLLCFSKHSLARLQLVFCWFVLAASVAFHSTHVLIAIGLLACLLVLAYWPDTRAALSGWLLALTALTAGVGAMFAFAFVSQLVFGSWPQNLPFLTARGLEDGPVAEMVERGCEGSGYAICDAAPITNRDSQFFLWSSDGYYQSASAQTQAMLREQDLEVFLAAAREYPMMQFISSARNFAVQFGQFGLFEFGTAKRVLAESAPNYLSAENLERFEGSLVVREKLPLKALSLLVYISAIAALLFVAQRLRRQDRPGPLAALVIIVLLTLVGNAVICGVLSDPHHRYQARVIWLLPYIAILLLFVRPHKQAGT